jgi:hypothetical protein
MIFNIVFGIWVLIMISCVRVSGDNDGKYSASEIRSGTLMVRLSLAVLTILAIISKFV